MTQATSADGAALSAQQLGDRVLTLIQSVRNAHDLSPQNIEKQTGLKIEVNPDNSSDYGIAGKLTEQWYYGLRSMSTAPGEAPNRVLFELNDQTHADADMSPVCVSFEHYNQTLTAAGFASRRLRNRVGTQDYWDFTRGDVGVTVYVRGKTRPQDEQVCVSMLIINAYA